MRFVESAVLVEELRADGAREPLDLGVQDGAAHGESRAPNAPGLERPPVPNEDVEPCATWEAIDGVEEVVLVGDDAAVAPSRPAGRGEDHEQPCGRGHPPIVQHRSARSWVWLLPSVAAGGTEDLVMRFAVRGSGFLLRGVSAKGVCVDGALVATPARGELDERTRADDRPLQSHERVPGDRALWGRT